MSWKRDIGHNIYHRSSDYEKLFKWAEDNFKDFDLFAQKHFELIRKNEEASVDFEASSFMILIFS